VEVDDEVDVDDDVDVDDEVDDDDDDELDVEEEVVTLAVFETGKPGLLAVPVPRLGPPAE
jgi:hypothetical protein